MTHDRRTSPVDLSNLEDLRGGGNLFHEVIKQYLSDTPPHLSTLREALVKGDAETVRRTAHLIRGASSHFNAKTMQALCGRLETQAKSGSLTGARELVDALDGEFERVRTALEAERNAA